MLTNQHTNHTHIFPHAQMQADEIKIKRLYFIHENVIRPLTRIT